MPILSNCPSCGGPLRVPDELQGRQVKCPRCGTTFAATAAGERGLDLGTPVDRDRPFVPATGRRPTSVTVIAVLHLIFGSLGLLCGACAGIIQMSGLQEAMAKQQPAGQEAPFNPVKMQEHMEKKAPGFKAFTTANLTVNIIFPLVLVISGIGLLKLKPWSRSLSILYSLASILFGIFYLVYELGWVWPATNEFMQDEINRMPAGKQRDILQMTMSLGIVTVFFVGLLYIIYPLVVVLILMRSKVAAVFGGSVPDQIPPT